MKDFSGKTAFVTGAANGIGLGICRALARDGVNIVLADIEQA
jgi:NAD(P)-dependent dehydrogenase (short-subunit alcohol dehydrogenase family)